MSEEAETNDRPLDEQLLERFFAAHPGGGRSAFSKWATSQPELSDPQLRIRVEGVLGTWLAAAELLASPDTDPDPETSFHRPRTGRPDSADRAADGSASDATSGAGDEGHRGSLRAGERVGRFRLIRFIASGGMGQVWEAEDEHLRAPVALKLVLPTRLDTRTLELFAREARAGGRLHHPNIVTTLAFGIDDGLAWIAQELVDGCCTLKDALDSFRSDEALPKDYFRSTAELVAQVADGLACAHGEAVIHRDVKPANILVTPTNVPKLADFGLARIEDDSTYSISGELIGTWAYMSPEQVTGKRMGIDHRTDVFSLGVVLYELLTLRKPFEGDTTHQIATQIIAHHPPDPTKIRSQCPHELAVIAGKSIEKDPARRYSSAKELAADLRNYLDARPLVARPPGALRRAQLWARRNRKSAFAGAALILLLGTTSFGWLQEARVQALESTLLQTGQLNLALLRVDERYTSGPPISAEDSSKLDAAIRALSEVLGTIDGAMHEQALALAAANEGIDEDDVRDWMDAAASYDESVGPLTIDRLQLALAGLAAEKIEPTEDLPVDELIERFESLAASVQSCLAGREALEALTPPHEGVRGLQALLNPDIDGPKIRSVATLLTSARAWVSLRLRGLNARLEESARLQDRAPAAAQLWRGVDDRLAMHELYSQTELAPQLDLLPLGPDPDSNLEEFAHLPSGTAPVRDAAGRLELDAESAIVLVLVPGGMLGSLPPDYPRRESTYVAPFLLAKHETSRAQYERLAAFAPELDLFLNNPVYDARNIGQNRKPANSVDWSTAASILSPAGLRLPWEGEWLRATMANRGWPTTVSAWKDSENVASGWTYVGPTDDDWIHEFDGLGTLTPIDGMQPNRWGFHQLNGNVTEWCLDPFSWNPTNILRLPNPSSPEGAVDTRQLMGQRVLAGSHWLQDIDFPVDQWIRDRQIATGTSRSIGFRAARSLR